MVNPLQFFRLIYQHTLDPANSYIAWGSIDRPLYLTVQEFISGSDLLGEIPQDVDLYFTPLVLKEPSRRKESVIGGSVVWADVDVHRGIKEPLVPPTVKIKSGHGYHLYWCLDNYYAPEDIERANKVLFNHLDQSGNEWNRSRVLRVPGSVNWKCRNPKYQDRYKEPVPCEIVEWNTEYIYSLGDLTKLQSFPNDFLTTPVYDGGEIDQSRRDWKLVTKLFDWGLQEYAVKSALLYHSGKAQERPHDYVDMTIRKVQESFSQNGASASPGGERDNQSYANAELEPVAWLIDPEGREAGLAVRIRWPGHHIVAAATARNFLNGRSVTEWFARNNAPNRIWTASDGKAKAYYHYLVARCPNRKQLQVEHAGRYELDSGTRVYVYDTDKALVYPGDAEMGVFWRPEIKVDSRLILDEQGLGPTAGGRMLSLIQKVQPPEVLQPALGWLLMAPFKTLLWEVAASMPILLLFGFPGAGKSSFIGRALMPLLGSFDRHGRFPRAVAADSTAFSVLGQATQTQSWPIWFGEFRPSNPGAFEFERLLREVYDETFESRGRPDLSVAQFQLVAPVVVDGEGPFNQAANIERTLAIQLHKEAVDVGSPYNQAFQELLRIPPAQFRQFARSYLQWTLTKTSSDILPYLLEGQSMFIPYTSTNRVVNNVSVAWAGLSVLQQFVREQEWPTEIAQDLNAFLCAMGTTHIKGLGVRTEADNLIELVSHFADNPSLDTVWEVDADILWFNLVRVRHLLKVVTDPAMLTIQLQQRASTYLRGPKRLHGAEFWGIHIDTAMKLGLNVKRPYTPLPEPIRLIPDDTGVAT